ncbi:MAG: hypothetical protein UY87_C0004G0021 [Candidatus Peribacteria bacterium GW2011_GWC2_54_8]|nr:MAG: hypothetical protein UY87_C0004G0021 [Candidatus Peribacteria bacterium GW2011_GWC2_54_8]
MFLQLGEQRMSVLREEVERCFVGDRIVRNPREEHAPRHIAERKIVQVLPDAVVLVAGMHGEFIDVNPVRILETEEVFHESSGIFERCTEFLEFSPIMRDESPHNLPLLLGYEAVL